MEPATFSMQQGLMTGSDYDLFDNEGSHVVCPSCGSDQLEMRAPRTEKFSGKDKKKVWRIIINCKCWNCKEECSLGFRQNSVDGLSIAATVKRCYL
jgi:hypothetical protein